MSDEQDTPFSRGLEAEIVRLNKELDKARAERDKLREYEARTRDTICWNVECEHIAQGLNIAAAAQVELDAARKDRDEWRERHGVQVDELAKLGKERYAARAETADAEERWKAELEHANTWWKRAHEAEAACAAMRTALEAIQSRLSAFGLHDEQRDRKTILDLCRAALEGK